MEHKLCQRALSADAQGPLSALEAQLLASLLVRVLAAYKPEGVCFQQGPLMLLVQAGTMSTCIQLTRTGKVVVRVRFQGDGCARSRTSGNVGLFTYRWSCCARSPTICAHPIARIHSSPHLQVPQRARQRRHLSLRRVLIQDHVASVAADSAGDATRVQPRECPCAATGPRSRCGGVNGRQEGRRWHGSEA
eukprot:353003-Chlamydomonas_euryale.AAC.1